MLVLLSLSPCTSAKEVFILYVECLHNDIIRSHHFQRYFHLAALYVWLALEFRARAFRIVVLEF